MGLIPTKTVSWTRRVQSGKSPIGEPTYSTVSGFPLSVVGVLENGPGRAKPGGGGLKVPKVATFRSETYADGLEGDLVTIGAKVFLVLEVIDNTGAGLTCSHTEYGLGKGT